MKTKIAYIDDDVMNLEAVQAVYEDDFDVVIYSNPEKFLQDYPNTNFVSILMDIHMPVMDGFTLYEKVISHPSYNGCPILFISSDESDTARIRSLTLGAVDFIGRMINPDEMIARLKSKIQFFQNHRNVIEFDGLKVNLTQLKTSLEGRDIPLTFIELKMLLSVLRSYPDPVPKDVLIENIWKATLVQDATIHTHIFNLNSKLQLWKYEVQTSKSKGVQLVLKASCK